MRLIGPRRIVDDGSDIRRVRPCLLAWLLVALAASAAGQSIARKHLFTSLGLGAGLLSITQAGDSVTALAATSGSVTLRVSYAFTRRFSLGFHYDRIGSDRVGRAVDHLRFNSYAVSAAFRFWIRERHFAEAHLALGSATLSLDLYALPLPVVGSSGCTTLGARYVRLLSSTLCVFSAVELSAGSTVYLQQYDGAPFNTADGVAGSLDWSNQRFMAGLAVRF